jgi:WD40 repeat protein
VSFSPDGSRVATFHNDLSIHLVDLRQGTSRRLGYHQDIVFEMVFSPDSDTLVSASYDRTIRLWDTGGSDHRTLRGHSHGVGGVAFSPAGDRLTSVSYDGTLRIWGLDNTSARDDRSLHAYIQSQTTATLVTTEHERARTPAGLR